jgi:ubiquitin thioesterase OTU1
MIKIKSEQASVGGVTKAVTFKLSNNSTLEELCDAVVTIPNENLELVFGFPPKPIVSASASDTLTSLGIASGDVVHARVGTASMVNISRLKIASDNSCLFRAIGYCLENHMKSRGVEMIDVDSIDVASYRQKIATYVLENEGKNDFVCEPMLGMEPKEYAAWIVNPEKWGGELEMVIFSIILKIKIKAIDIQTGILYSYGEEQQDEKYEQDIKDDASNKYCSMVCILLYDGVHYDCIIRGSQTLFSINDSRAIDESQAVATFLRQTKQFTNVNDKSGSFQLRCLDCSQGLEHADAAREHATLTGHQNFSQA